MTNRFDDVAQILRGLREDVENLKEQRSQSGSVNVYRSETERSLSSDSVSVTTEPAGWTWGSSQWDIDEFE